MNNIVQENPEPSRRKNAFFIGLLSFFGGISQDMFAPILPIYLTSVLGFDKTFVGIADGLVSAAAYLFRVASGFVSDAVKNKKPVIFVGYFLSALARPLLAFVSQGASILGLRALDGAGKGIKDPPKDIVVAGSSAQASRGASFGMVRMLDTLGSVAGPLILFGILSVAQEGAASYRWILLMSAVPLAFTLAVLVFGVRETAGGQRVEDEAGRRGITALPKSFFAFLAIVAVFALGNSSDAFLILRARQIGVSVLEIPLVIALFNFAYAMAAVPFGSLSDKIGRIPTMLIGWGSYALMYAGFALAPYAFAVWFLYALYGVYYATSEGVAKAFIADLVPRGVRGRAFGLYGATIGLATLPASFFMGFLWDRFGAQPAFLFGAGMAVVAGVGLLAFSKKLKSAYTNRNVS